jgi:hypothetical protein
MKKEKWQKQKEQNVTEQCGAHSSTKGRTGDDRAGDENEMAVGFRIFLVLVVVGVCERERVSERESEREREWEWEREREREREREFYSQSLQCSYLKPTNLFCVTQGVPRDRFIESAYK